MDNKIDDWKLKFRSMIRKQNINMLAWQENNPNPQTEEECNELINILKKLEENVYNYRDNIRVYGWVKTRSTIPLDETKLLEQQKWLEENQHPEGNGN